MVGSQHDHKPPRFPFSRTYSVADILELGLPTPVSVTGSTAIFVDHVAPLEHAGTNAVTFCRSVGTKCVDQCNSSEATMIIVAEPMTETEDRCYIQVLDPLAWFSALVDRLFETENSATIHPTAEISPASKIGENVTISAYAEIQADVIVGPNSYIGAGARLLNGCSIGRGCKIGAYTIIGDDGFSHYKSKDGNFLTLKNLGTSLIGDDVIIGNHSSVVRGVIDNTFIDRGCRIGNYVNIGHNCKVGPRTAIYVGAILTGSCVVEADVTIAARSVINNAVSIGSGAKIGMNSTVTKNVRPGSSVFGTPAREIRTIRSL